jgi:hypothetical protein
VIAETKDLGTGYDRKIVVTDDQGRPTWSPIFRKRINDVGCARLRPGGFSRKFKPKPGQKLDLKAVTSLLERSRKRRRNIIPPPTGIRCCTFRRRAISPAPERVEMASRDTHQEPGRVGRTRKDRRLRVLPSIGRQGDARDSPKVSARSIRPSPRGIGAFNPAKSAAR